jgi:hypothetical protein
MLEINGLQETFSVAQRIASSIAFQFPYVFVFLHLVSGLSGYIKSGYLVL